VAQVQTAAMASLIVLHPPRAKTPAQYQCLPRVAKVSPHVRRFGPNGTFVSGAHSTLGMLIAFVCTRLTKRVHTRHCRRSSIQQGPICLRAAKRKLGSSSLDVTEACLGTMTWGVQNTEEEAHAQLDYAIKERGINFIDTAELYPVPMTAAEWCPGTTEDYIGSWLAKNPKHRSEILVATKVVGFFPKSRVAARRQLPECAAESWPDGRLDAKSVKAACDASLRRLKRDHIDLYQLHWPDRYVPIFGSTEYKVQNERQSVDIEETASALKELMDSGKIKAYGLSNETTFGVCEWVRVADKIGLPRPASIQNACSLIVRNFEGELAEACAESNYNIGLLPWSILAGGLLSGKYQPGQPAPPPNSRHVKYPDFMRRWGHTTASSGTIEAVAEYAKIAQEVGMSLAELSIRWARDRSYCKHGSVIIGATSLEQLKENIDAFEGPSELPEDVREKIDQVHLKWRSPGSGL